MRELKSRDLLLASISGGVRSDGRDIFSRVRTPLTATFHVGILETIDNLIRVDLAVILDVTRPIESERGSSRADGRGVKRTWRARDMVMGCFKTLVYWTEVGNLGMGNLEYI